jgi:MFS family permease
MRQSPTVHRVVASAEVTKFPGDAAAPAVSRGSWGFIAIYAGAYTGTWLALLTPIMVTLALRLRELAPAQAANHLSLVLSVGALFALFGNPMFGRLSDSTTSRWGMRRPWLVGGTLLGFLSLAFIAVAPSVGWVLVGWCLAQLAYNAVLAPLAALLPDQVPVARRGTVAGIIGICTCIGQLTGTFLTNAVSGSMLPMFLVPAAVGGAAVLLLAFVLEDRRATPAEVERLSWREFGRSLWMNPTRHPDFAWICTGRFFMMMAMAFFMAYQPFYLMSRLGFSAAQVPHLVFQSTLVQTLTSVTASLLAGRLSDLTKRRKPFVIGAALSYAAGAALVACADSYSLFLVGMAIAGVGLGAYLGVDFALATDALPNRERDAAKDLGLFNIASALPQSIAPVLASVILVATAGSYPAVFAAAGLVAVFSAVAILPVRRVR